MKWKINPDGSASSDDGKAWYIIRTKFIVERLETFGGTLTNTGSVSFKHREDAENFVKDMVDSFNRGEI